MMERTAAQTGWRGRRRARVGARVNALFIVPVPLLFTAFGGGPVNLMCDLLAFFALIGGARLTRDGLLAEDAYDARDVARKPRLPRKMMGTGATAIGLALAGLPDPVAAVIFALMGAGLHLAAFGLDPLRDKRAPQADDLQSDRVARAVDEAEETLAQMRAAAARTRDRALEARVDRFADTARAMFRRVEADPRDLTGARRWLGVYLSGARDAAVKYADLDDRSGGHSAARRDFLAFLDDLEQGFAARTDRMLTDDRSELDLEIDVLRDRLRQEGVLAEADGTKD